MTSSARENMQEAIRKWMAELRRYPGWREWKKQDLGQTLFHGDELYKNSADTEKEFKFSSDVEIQHDLLLQYLRLCESLDLLKQCEFYFRRYPFRGLPVTRYSHATNICEMFFSRFYEFRERMKRYFAALKTAAPEYRFQAGPLIKAFDKEFDQELRVRNTVHHHRRFGDIAIDQIFMLETLLPRHRDSGWEEEYRRAYRRFSKEWAQRVKRRSEKVDEFLEAISCYTLDTCDFLK
jgi:hypothetical protein